MSELVIGRFLGSFGLNQNYSGASNVGEIQIITSADNRVLHPNGKTFLVSTTAKEIGTEFEGAINVGKRYIMYIGQDFTRFKATKPYNAYTEDFVYCYNENDVWYYGHNSTTYYKFSPNWNLDCIVAEFEKTSTLSTSGIDTLTQYDYTSDSRVPTNENLTEKLKIDWQPSDYYNVEDLNRVESATRIVRDKIASAKGIVIQDLVIIENRDETHIEFFESLNRIETNIKSLASTFGEGISAIIETKTDWTYNVPFDFNDANRLEQNLYFMFTNIEANLSALPYCGMYIVGQEGVY